MWSGLVGSHRKRDPYTDRRSRKDRDEWRNNTCDKDDIRNSNGSPSYEPLWMSSVLITFVELPMVTQGPPSLLALVVCGLAADDYLNNMRTFD
jgi:hypothetical protein